MLRALNPNGSALPKICVPSGSGLGKAGSVNDNNNNKNKVWRGIGRAGRSQAHPSPTPRLSSDWVCNFVFTSPCPWHSCCPFKSLILSSQAFCPEVSECSCIILQRVMILV